MYICNLIDCHVYIDPNGNVAYRAFQETEHECDGKRFPKSRFIQW